MLNLIFLNKCIICQKILSKNQNYFCNKCESKTLLDNICPKCSSYKELNLTNCKFCQKMNNEKIIIKAIFPYVHPYKQSIFKWKYSGIRKYGKGFAYILKEQLNLNIIDNIDGIIPVPISKERLMERGFNQAHDFAKYLGTSINIPIYDIIKRHKNTTRQYSQDKAQRQQNTDKSMLLDISKAKKLLPKKKTYNFIIADDIYTTGATISECLKALNSYCEIGIIIVLVVCIVI
ncbi:MAG: hypothetical protein ATN32_06275 [Candidatus Epulonipiscium fishelsonii]|nr:MAG: hypothetical protein ATN32_06275 [Epulopiscium sp. AS2M-Bin002]